jgi:hypothetical protein
LGPDRGELDFFRIDGGRHEMTQLEKFDWPAQ